MIYQKTIETCVWQHQRHGTYLTKRIQDKRISGDNLVWTRNIHSAYLGDNVPPFILKLADRIEVTITTEIEVKNE